jgi:hypothetical protein
MSETPSTEPTSAAEEITESSPAPSPESDAAAPADQPLPEAEAKNSPSAPRASKLPLWIAVAASVLAVVATSVAVVGWFYPHKSASSAPTYTDQQVKDAKKHMCETFRLVDHEVVRNSRLKNPPDGGPIGALSVASAARLAFYSGGAFLRDRVSQEPATPPDLAKSLNAMASNLEELAIGYLAGSAEFAMDELRQSLDDKIKATIEMCK